MTKEELFCLFECLRGIRRNHTLMKDEIDGVFEIAERIKAEDEPLAAKPSKIDGPESLKMDKNAKDEVIHWEIEPCWDTDGDYMRYGSYKELLEEVERVADRLVDDMDHGQEVTITIRCIKGPLPDEFKPSEAEA